MAGPGLRDTYGRARGEEAGQEGGEEDNQEQELGHGVVGRERHFKSILSLRSMKIIEFLILISEYFFLSLSCLFKINKD